MRKLLLIIIVACPLLMAGCKDDKEPSVVGSWLFKSITYDIQGVDETKVAEIKEEVGRKLELYTGKVIVFQNDYTVYCYGESQGQYAYSKRKLTIKFADNSFASFKVVSINKQSATLEADYTEVVQSQYKKVTRCVLTLSATKQ